MTSGLWAATTITFLQRRLEWRGRERKGELGRESRILWFALRAGVMSLRHYDLRLVRGKVD